MYSISIIGDTPVTTPLICTLLNFLRSAAAVANTLLMALVTCVISLRQENGDCPGS